MKTNGKQYFPPGVIEYVKRYNSEEMYLLRSLDEYLDISNKDMERIASICNEEQIYRFLFKDRLGGREYTVTDAENFISWAKDCWKKQQSFFFLMQDTQGAIVACLDISSSDFSGSPIGYWVTSNVRGIMTNSVLKLCELAGRIGYKKLFALVEPGNGRSAGVLMRAGFSHKGIQIEEIRFMNEPTGTQKLFERYENELEC